MIQRLLLVCCLLLGGVAQANDAGVDPEEVRLGASMVLTGPLGPQTADYAAGSRLLFDAVNATGGIHGRQLRYTTLDDAFDVAQSVENTKRLLSEHRVFLIYNNTGTAHAAAALPLLKTTRTVMFGPVTGASVFRESVNPLLFHVRASYANEARRILSHLKQIGLQRVAVFYQDDPFGHALLAEVKRAAEQEGMPLSGEIRVDPRQPDFAAAAAQTAQANPQAVVIGSAGTTFTRYIAAVHQAGRHPTFYGFSVASPDVIRRELLDKARGIVLAQIMPSLRNAGIPVVAQYLKLLREKDPQAQPSASQFEGFVHATLLVEGLRRAGRNLNTDSFIQAMEGIGELSLGAFTARYSPRNHNGISHVELAIIGADGQLRY